MKNAGFFLAFAMAAISAVLVSCPTSNGGGGLSESPVPSSSPTPVDTVDFEADGSGWVFFETNDAAYAGDTGSTVWRLGSQGEAPMAEFSASLRKESGSAKGGFGIVFCASASRFLAVLVDTEGNYAIGAVEAGSWRYLDPEAPWKHADRLKQGYGIENTLSVRRKPENAGACEFQLSINGEAVETFIDSGGTPPAGGLYGFICVIGKDGDEEFPERSVKVGFKELVPADIGAEGTNESVRAARLGIDLRVKMEAAIW